MTELIDFIVSSMITPDLRSYLEDLAKSNPDSFKFCICLLGIFGTRAFFDILSKVKKNA